VPTEGVPLRRPVHPTAKPPYHVRIWDQAQRERWETIAAVMPEEMTACWDHLAYRPGFVLPNGRCHELRGSYRGIWQYKPSTGHNYRVWYRFDEKEKTVLVTQVYDHHP
jgi:mRNA-degrading endonuclease RelE of RelBE toxin-antitoxin system